MRRAIMDAGPLVAWFCTKDAHHQWARRTLAQLPTGVFVCEAVLAEACHLASKDGVPSGKLLQLVEKNDLILHSLGGEIAAIRSLLDRYADVPMDFGDACVVRLALLQDDPLVYTTDGDFNIYRRAYPQIMLVAPFA